MSLNRLKPLLSGLGALVGAASSLPSTTAPVNALNTPLPPLAFWQARSFWLTLVTILLGAFPQLGRDLLELLGLSDASQLVDVIMNIVPLATGLWAWLERRAPNRRLVLSTGG